MPHAVHLEKAELFRHVNGQDNRRENQLRHHYEHPAQLPCTGRRSEALSLSVVVVAVVVVVVVVVVVGRR